MGNFLFLTFTLSTCGAYKQMLSGCCLNKWGSKVQWKVLDFRADSSSLIPENLSKQLSGSDFLMYKQSGSGNMFQRTKLAIVNSYKLNVNRSVCCLFDLFHFKELRRQKKNDNTILILCSFLITVTFIIIMQHESRYTKIIKSI